MQQLLSIMQQLRQQCPWDQKQTPESLTQYAIEEAYEVEAAVRSGKVDDVRDELGDLLLQVVFQAQMYSEQGAFDFQDVVQAICDKLIRRHPHVFQAEQFAQLSAEDVAALWKTIKQQEKQGKAKSRLDEVKHAPALVQAQQIQQHAAQLGFDFHTVQDAYGKLEEERNNMDILLDRLKIKNNIKKWYYGHFHTRKTEIIDNIEFNLVDVCEFREFLSYKDLYN